MNSLFKLSRFRSISLFRTFTRSIASTSTRMAPIIVDEGDPGFPKLEAPYLKLYSLGTPNGQKITIYLELLKLSYHYRNIDIRANTQKDPWFIKLNGNGKIPVLSDVDIEGNRKTIAESGAMLLYLGDKYDKENKYYYPHDHPLYYEQLQWLIFQVASHGPYQGQAAHFVLFAKEKVPYGIERFKSETERIFGVFDNRLKENNGWLVGDKLNIADIAAFPWIKLYPRLEIDIEPFPHLKAWVEKISDIPEIEKGLSV